jgi:hypothetical protein
VLAAGAATAHAQPAPAPTPVPDGPPPDLPPPDAATPPPDPAAPTDAAPAPAPTAPAAAATAPDPVDGWVRGTGDAAPTPPPPPFEAPDVLLAPSARLLPAGLIYSRSLLDTSGGFAGDLRVGLGDVAEFGVGTTDLVRERATADAAPERIAPYATATFRMGVAEDRLFRGMPAVALGFRKSFERRASEHTTRIAELHLVGTRRLGARTILHLGAVFWDASLQPDGGAPILLHDRGLGRQVRPVGGIELRPLDDAQILVDLAWVPEVCYGCAGEPISLTAILSWGVRYEVAPWLRIESGVRVPDIDDANLLDAQIFGQLTMVSRTLQRLVER